MKNKNYLSLLHEALKVEGATIEEFREWFMTQPNFLDLEMGYVNGSNSQPTVARVDIFKPATLDNLEVK